MHDSIDKKIRHFLTYRLINGRFHSVEELFIAGDSK